jgi:hypothetical protein
MQTCNRQFPSKNIYVTQPTNNPYTSQIFYSKDGVLEELLVCRLSAAPDATTLRRLQRLSCFSSVYTGHIPVSTCRQKLECSQLQL